MVVQTKAKEDEGGRSVEEALSYALGHRIRIEVLAILHEGTRTPDELAKMMSQPLGRVTHHIRELLESGSIELAKTEQARNATRHFYRAIEVPFYSDEEIAAMPPEARQATAGLILQAIMAESLASFWAGKMIHDPRVWLSWRWFNVDDQGRDEIAEEQAESWARVQAIEARAAARRAQSAEQATSIIVASLGFERSRGTSPTPPATFGKTD
jgi:DNA-binding transcriptional ArsR family regulator